MNVYLNLLYQFHLKHYIVHNRLVFIAMCVRSELIVQRVVPAQIVVKRHHGHQQLLVGKLIKGAQYVTQSQYLAKQTYKTFLFFLVKYVGDTLYRELFEQLLYQLYVGLMATAFLVVVTCSIILFKSLHEHKARCVLVTKDSQTLVGSLFQISEAHNITAVLYGIQYAISTTIGLKQSVHLQVLIHPQCVQCLGIKASQEHTYHNQDINLLVLHTQRHILVITLESLAIGTEVGVWRPHLVIIVDSLCQRIPALQVQFAYTFGVFVATQAPLVFLGFVSLIGIDGGYFKIGSSRLCQLFLKLIIIENSRFHTIYSKYTVKLMLLGLFVEVLNNVSGYDTDALRVMQCLVGINTPHHLTVHTILHSHRALVVDMETQHVLISYGINDGISMECFSGFTVCIGFATKQLSRGTVLATLMGINSKDRRTRKTKHKVALKLTGYLLAHIAKLRAMTLIEYQHHIILGKYLV